MSRNLNLTGQVREHYSQAVEEVEWLGMANHLNRNGQLNDLLRRVTADWEMEIFYWRLMNRPIPQMGVLALLGDSPEEAPLIAQLPARHGGCAICH